MISLVVAAALFDVVRAWNCSPIQIFVDGSANNTIGLQSNGSSAQLAYSNVQDAADQVALYVQNWNDSSSYPQVTVNIAQGTYYMDTYLFLTGAHSGVPDCPTVWKANGDVVLSGGMKIDNWTKVDGTEMWSASVPINTETRSLYVDGVHATRARTPSIAQNQSTYTLDSYATNASFIDLSSISGLGNVELRFVGTFTDRYTPVDHLAEDGQSLIMKQPAWYRNLIGYDVVSKPGILGLYLGTQGLYLENSLSFLDQDGEWFLDAGNSTLYYQPINGTDPNTSEIIIPKLDVLLALTGLSYDEPAHDIQFENITWAHTGWNYPTSKYGFADQQTGAYLGGPFNYSTFEASRPFWYQTPGAVQVSVAERIVFNGGGITCTGAASLGIGNDANAHLLEIGLGAKNISVQGMTLSQSGGNVIQVGGVRADAHHPYRSEMINSGISISNNWLHDNNKLFTSATNILLTYVQYSSISHNTVENSAYSGLSQGWGWGSNDVGANPSYIARNLYAFQPLYETPTTLHDNYIGSNLISMVGQNHTDEGGIYCLSASPGTIIEKNAIINSPHVNAMYLDEGSRLYTVRDNVFSGTLWYTENTQNNGSTLTGDNLFIDNYASQNNTLEEKKPNGSNFTGNIFFNDTRLPWPQGVQDIVDAAGIDW